MSDSEINQQFERNIAELWGNDRKLIAQLRSELEQAKRRQTEIRKEKGQEVMALAALLRDAHALLNSSYIVWKVGGGLWWRDRRDGWNKSFSNSVYNIRINQMLHARSDYNRIQDPAVENPSLANGSSPIAKDEPVFILRAQDETASAVVRFWAALNAQGDPTAVRLAIEQARRMDAWPKKKTADV